MPFYRYGAPGADSWAHLNFGHKAGPRKCIMPRFPEDKPEIGDVCGRPSAALCDHPGCDKPICSHHRTRDPIKANTDYCSEHSGDAKQ